MKPYHISTRTRKMESPIMQVMKGLRRPEGTLDLSQGIPFFGPPGKAIEESMRKPDQTSRYGPDAGDPELVESIIEKLGQYNRIKGLTNDNIMVTAGANIAFLNAVSAIGDPEDEMILIDPFYFNHGMTLDLLGIKQVHCRPEGQEQFSVDMVARRITDRTRAIVLVSPNNPTGEVAPRSFVRGLLDLCVSNGIWLISDETYDMFIYEGDHLSPGSLGDDLPVISIYSMSKAYGMSGFRIGYMSFPERLFDNLLKVQDTTVICPSRIGQRVAMHCLKYDRNHSSDYRTELNEMRLQIIRWIETNSDIIRAYRPAGAFYTFFHVDDKRLSGKDSMEMASDVLENARVLLVPGRPFGSDAPPYMRISYGNVNSSDLKISLERLSEWLDP